MYPFFKSFTYAIKGIQLSLKQLNMKVLVVCAFVAIFLGFVLEITIIEWCIILMCIGIVLSLEIINTTIENLVDLVEPNHNPKAGAIKDLSAGAVLVFSIISAVIGIMIFGKYILNLLFIF
jgi:diacylglycerol kinase (ATP)